MMVAVNETGVTPNWASHAVLAQEIWEIRVPLGRYASEQAGIDAANEVKVRFAMDGDRAAVEVQLAERGWMAHDDDVLIFELSAAVQKRLGAPLDVRDPEARQRAVAALDSNDPAYIVEESDFVRSGLTLADFLARYGAGYQPDVIGYWVAVDAGDAASIEASAEMLPSEMEGEELFVEIMDSPVYDGMQVVEEGAA